MRRGEIVTVAVQGDYGKPRPAVVIQSDWLAETDSVLVCLLTSTVRETPLYRLTVPPTPETGLRQVSQVMADKIMAVRRDKCGPAIGRLDGGGHARAQPAAGAGRRLGRRLTGHSPPRNILRRCP